LSFTGTDSIQHTQEKDRNRKDMDIRSPGTPLHLDQSPGPGLGYVHLVRKCLISLNRSLRNSLHKARYRTLAAIALCLRCLEKDALIPERKRRLRTCRRPGTHTISIYSLYFSPEKGPREMACARYLERYRKFWRVLGWTMFEGVA